MKLWIESCCRLSHRSIDNHNLHSVLSATPSLWWPMVNYDIFLLVIFLLDLIDWHLKRPFKHEIVAREKTVCLATESE